MNLKKLLMQNNIGVEYIDSIVLNIILLSIFEEIYTYLEKDNHKYDLLNELRKGNSNKILINFIYKIIDFKLSEREEQYLVDLIFAYIRKKEVRKRISDDIKRNILGSQENKCNICKLNIELENSHLDHIVPFKLVGDELVDNYQILCNDCNSHKSSSITYILKGIIKPELLEEVYLYK